MKLLVVSSKENLADYDELVETLCFLGTETMCVNRLEYCSVSESFPFYVVPSPKLLGLIKQFNPDFVMTDTPYYTLRMSKLVDRRALLHMLGDPWSELYSDGGMYPSLFARMYTRYLAAIFASSVRKADIIFVNSMWLQERIKEKLPSYPTRVLYLGIDPEKWVSKHHASIDLKHPAALGLFPFNIYAKVLGLVKFTEVIRKMPDVNFYFAGDGPFFSLVKQTCPPNMILVGRVSRLRAKRLLESADIFVHPSGLDVLPRSVKEASLMEKPIVASKVGGIPEIVKDGETGYLCEINNVEKWTKRIHFLLENPDVATELGRNARRFVMNKFAWGKISLNFLNDLGVFEK
jgi:glycosyltransferase involved in cell wall biosynthesis